LFSHHQGHCCHCATLRSLCAGSIDSAPDAPVVFFQVPVSLLALSFYISTPSTSLEGSRKSDSDTTRKNLTPPTTSKLSDNFYPRQRHQVPSRKNKTTNLPTHSTKVFLRRFEDLLSQIFFSLATTRLFSNNTSLHTSKNYHLQNEVRTYCCCRCCRPRPVIRSHLGRGDASHRLDFWQLHWRLWLHSWLC
jgi:hypothetical protein